MSSQLDILRRNHRNDTQPYRFYLQNASKGLIELSMQPDGWSDGEVEYKRSETYKGLSRTLTVKELIFVKEARDYIQWVYENFGPGGEVIFTVDYRKQDYTYDQYYQGKLDLFTYFIDEIGVKVQVIDNSFVSKVYTRDDLDLNLLNETAVDGEAITTWADQNVTMPDTSIDRNSVFHDAAAGFVDESPHLCPLVEDSSDFSETQGQTMGDAITAANGFFTASFEDRILQVTGTCTAEAVGDGNSHDWTFGIIARIFNSDGSFFVDVGLDIDEFTGDSPSFSLSWDKQITLYTGQSMALIAEVSPVTSPGSVYKFSYTGLDMTCDETFIGTPLKQTMAFGYYEAFLRVLQLMTGKNSPFYSDYFGRTDTPIITYGSNGEIGFVVRGIFFRIPFNMGWDNNLFPLTVSFRDLFITLANIYGLGMAVETISGDQKVRVETLSHFFDANVVLDISDRLRPEAISKECKADWYYKQIDTGYNRFEYAAVEGLYEYNTKSSYATVNVTKSKLDLIAKYRADNQGIRLLLRAPGEEEYEFSKDYKGDEDIFLIRGWKDGSTYKASLAEDFSLVGGTIYADRSFNLNITPARNLLRNGKTIRAGLKYAPLSLLRWQTSEKNTALFTQLTTESAPVYENADIPVSDLDAPLWLNEVYRVEFPIYPTDKLAIDANMNGLIKIATGKYGWILQGKTKNNNGKAEFDLLRCNTDVVTPIE